MKSFRVASPRVATACACILFLVSIMLPFLTIYYSTPIEIGYIAQYWSFRMTITPMFPGQSGMEPGISTTLFFNDYWFTTNRSNYSFSPAFFRVSLVFVAIFVAIFVAQIFTLGFGFTFLLKRRKMAQYLSIISCLFVVTAMAFASIRVTDESYLYLPSFLSSYWLGYWLIYPSIALFLYALFPKPPNNLETQNFSKYARSTVGIVILAVTPLAQFLVRNFLWTPRSQVFTWVQMRASFYLLRDGPFFVLMFAGLVLYVTGRKKFWISLGKRQNVINALLITLGLFLLINGFFYSWSEYMRAEYYARESIAITYGQTPVILFILWFISGITLLADNLKQLTSKSKPESLNSTYYNSAQR